MAATRQDNHLLARLSRRSPRASQRSTVRENDARNEVQRDKNHANAERRRAPADSSPRRRNVQKFRGAQPSVREDSFLTCGQAVTEEISGLASRDMQLVSTYPNPQNIFPLQTNPTLTDSENG